MRDARGVFGRGIGVCAAVLVTVVGLPLLALAAIVLRPVLVGAVVLAVVGGAVAYCVNPECRCWFTRHVMHREAPVTGRH